MNPDVMERDEARRRYEDVSRRAARRRRFRRWLRMSATAVSIGLVGGAFFWAVASLRDLDRPTAGRVPGTSESANYRFEDVRVASQNKRSATIAFGVGWQTQEYPGVRRCTWTALAADGTIVGQQRDGVMGLSPDVHNTSAKEDVPISGVAETAMIACDSERLDVGEPYAYAFSNIQVHTFGGISMDYNYHWLGPAFPGAMSCTGTVRDENGAIVAQGSRTLASGVLSGHGLWRFSPGQITSTVPVDSSSLTGGLECTPYTGSQDLAPDPTPEHSFSTIGAGKTFVEGARPTADANPATGKGCVQYSPDRPDVHICSATDIPAGWTPDPAPYFDRSICAQAAQWVNDPSSVASAHFLSLDGSGPVDVTTCEIVATNSRSSLDVVFIQKGGADNVHVEYRP
jgi:hypothetical protein